MRRTILGLALVLGTTGLAVGEEPAPEPETPETEETGAAESHDPGPWRPQLKSVREQLDLLALFAKATQFGGVAVNVPSEIQHVPLEQFEGMEKWAKRVDLYVKEIRFEDLDFEHRQDLAWREERPLLPALMRFGNIGASIDAKTRLGTFPVKADLRQGELPLDFAMREEGYDILVSPERRAEEAQIDQVDLDFGGPLAGPIVSRFFGKKLARLVLEFAAGQTLKLDRGGLLGGADLSTDLLGGEAGKVLNDPAVKGLLGDLLE